VSARDRALARAVSGPLGRGIAFAADLAAALLGALRRRLARRLGR
jgi:hypothetical protein